MNRGERKIYAEEFQIIHTGLLSLKIWSLISPSSVRCTWWLPFKERHYERCDVCEREREVNLTGEKPDSHRLSLLIKVNTNSEEPA